MIISASPPPTTLAAYLESSEIGMDELHSNYHPMLELVRLMIGVVPNCDKLLEIWTPAFRTYNLLIPNSLNLPFVLWGMGGAPKDMLGLATYASSASAQCAYCTAHTCSFALRRGTRPEAIVGAAGNVPESHQQQKEDELLQQMEHASQQQRSPKEAAVVALAEALSTVPVTLHQGHLDDMLCYFSPSELEWIVLGGVGMTGFLNKFMDVLGVELEEESLADVGALLSQSTDWKPDRHMRKRSSWIIPSSNSQPPLDSLRTYWKVLQLAPGAIRIEQEWLRGVPNQWPAAGQYLQQHTGHDFAAALGKVGQSRVVQAYAAILKENLTVGTTTIGLPVKALCGVLFGTLVGNRALVRENVALWTNNHYFCQDDGTLDQILLEKVQQLAKRADLTSASDIHDAMEQLTTRMTEREAAVLLLARAVSPSPARFDDHVWMEHAACHNLSAENIIEVVVWISVQQWLHRIMSFYAVADPDTA